MQTKFIGYLLVALIIVGLFMSRHTVRPSTPTVLAQGGGSHQNQAQEMVTLVDGGEEDGGKANDEEVANHTMEVHHEPEVPEPPRLEDLVSTPTSKANTTGPLTYDDICVVMISYEKRHRQLQQFKETWLNGVKHFFYSNKATKALPTYAFENHPGQAHVHWTGNNAGDYRWIPALHHANISCRPYKWMLLADDDSYMVLPNVLKFLTSKDHTVPLYLGFAHPPARGHKGAFCKGYKKRLKEPLTCCLTLDKPCYVPANRSTEPACPVSLMEDKVHWARVKKGEPEHEQTMSMFWHFGGACAIFSQGLFNIMPERPWLDCGMRTVCGGGDKRTASCIWNTAGLAITDISWAGLTQGQFGKPRAAVKKFLSFHRITPAMAAQLYNAELGTHMRRRMNNTWTAEVQLPPHP
mmetsp:Transcript_17275/g.30828  ORF Transcript_17275/g.30828 Transcript_17275/m.30828 type:complete len:409 (-) Transcript_17275:708-1934(-)